MVVITRRGRGGGGSVVGDRHGVLVRDGLQLEGLLLRVVCREYLVKRHETAVSIAGGDKETLTIRSPNQWEEFCVNYMEGRFATEGVLTSSHP